MNRDKQEMALWREAYRDSHCFLAQERARDADAAVAEFRKRYPAEPTAPAPTAPGLTWYDEPPFAKDGSTRPCWISGEHHACAVHWSGYAMSPEWVYSTTEDDRFLPLHGRRVCPITKPQEPTT